MRLRKIVLVLGAALAAMTLSAPPANAGNWATTYLDPLPSRLEPGQPYVVGFWVLQHGSHPSYDELGRVALVLTGDKGESRGFPGVALPEAAHYAAAIVVPHEGKWVLSASQGHFAGYEIGTLTVPGGLVLNPPPAAMAVDGIPQPWGAIRPPVGAILSNPLAAPPTTTSAAPAQSATPSSAVGTALAIAGLLGAATAVLFVLRRRHRGGRP